MVDKPLIQYAVEEAVQAGFTDMVFVTGRTKRSIEDHFDKAYELETELLAREKHDLLAAARSSLPEGVSCAYVRQSEALGLGHAVLCAEPLVRDEPFAVILADDLIDATPGALSQMVEAYHEHGASVLCVENVPRESTGSYGIVSTTPLDDRNERVLSIVEKPAPLDAPSTLAVVGRYILAPAVFRHLRDTQKGKGGEIQLTDAIQAMLADQPVIAHRFRGTRYDCGSKIGYMKAMVAYGRTHPEVGKAFSAWLDERQGRAG